jgi:hypothetical protein
MNKENLEIVLTDAESDIITTVNAVKNKYKLPACLLDLLLSRVLAEIRTQEQIELSLVYKSRQCKKRNKHEKTI